MCSSDLLKAVRGMVWIFSGIAHYVIYSEIIEAVSIHYTHANKMPYP